MELIRKSFMLGCALAVGGCAQGALGGSPGALSPSGLSALPATHFRVRSLGGGNPLIYDFQGDPDGATPYAGLVNAGGTLYGTTYYGGGNNLGAIFSVTTGGSESILHSFAGSDGEYPQASLIDVNGTLYGTTSAGSGSNAYGNVFSYTPGSGGFKVVYSFKAPPNDGVFPMADLTYANGALYGTTEGGGNAEYGTVFKIPLTGKNAGQESIVYSFQGSPDGGPDGARPLAGILYDDGLLYGTTYAGGAKGEGTLFAISLTTGKETILHSFGSNKKDGYEPQADLLLYKNTLYGTAANGGPANADCGGAGCGTVFKSTLAGKYKTLYAFDPYRTPSGFHEDGLRPLAGLINVSGTFYGTTEASTSTGSGTVFSVTPAGAESLVTVFACPQPSGCPPPWPSNPEGALIDVGGTLYGTTVDVQGGSGYGSVFALPI